MDILLIIGSFVIGAFLNAIIKPAAKTVYYLSLCYIALSVILVSSYWVLYLTTAKASILINTFEVRLRIGELVWYGMFGYFMFNILVAFRKELTAGDNDQLKKIIQSTLWSGSILTANLFIMEAAVGKIQPFTACYFTASGYAIWFFYFILTTEFLGGLGILFHFKFKTGVPAAALLMLIMIGALYTHRNNGEPLTRAHSAIIQFIMLSLMIVIYYLERQAKGQLKPYNQPL